MKEAAPTDSNEPTLPRTESDPLKREAPDPHFGADTPPDGWHYVRDGAAEGPLTHEALMQLLERGEIPADTLVWREGIPYWTPADVVRVLRRAPEVELEPAPPPLPTSVVTERPHPWLRLWARMFDGFLALMALTLVVWAGSGKPTPGELPPGWTHLTLGLAFTAVAAVAETIFLAGFGTTPGKALLGIRLVRSDGSRMGIPRAVIRSFGVWVLGMVGGLPLIVLAILWQGHRLVHEGTTWWDAKLDLRVMHKEPAPEMWLRYGAAVLAVLFAASLIGSLLMK